MKHQPIPFELTDASLLVETGWPPDVLDEQPDERIQHFLLYKAIKDVVENGGELRL